MSTDAPQGQIAGVIAKHGWDCDVTHQWIARCECGWIWHSGVPADADDAVVDETCWQKWSEHVAAGVVAALQLRQEAVQTRYVRAHGFGEDEFETRWVSPWVVVSPTGGSEK